MIKDNVWYVPEDFQLKKFNIVLVGCGGTGSHFVVHELVYLFRSLIGLGHQGFSLTVYDPSSVTQTNLVRQAFLPNQVGHNKASAAIWQTKMLYGIDRQANWTAVEGEFGKGEAERLNKTYVPTILVTMADTPQVRKQIGEVLKYNPLLLWLDAGNDETGVQVVLGHGGDQGLPCCTNLFSYADAPAENHKSCSADESLSRQELGVNSLSARLSGALLWNMLRCGRLKSHGALADSRDLSSQEILINPNTWAAFGYQQNTAA